MTLGRAPRAALDRMRCTPPLRPPPRHVAAGRTHRHAQLAHRLVDRGEHDRGQRPRPPAAAAA
eukprot:scaffold7729_cov471-Prasinococcus_capsulatus_cf.AAC.5